MKLGIVKSVLTGFRKHERTILTAVNIASTLAAVYCAVKDTPKLMETLDILREAEATNMEKVKAVAPVVARTAAFTTISVAASIANHKVASDTIHTLSDMCAVANLAKDEFRVHTEKIVGPEKIADIEGSIAQEHATRAIENSTAAIDTGKGHDLFYDDWSGRWFYCDINYIRKIENDTDNAIGNEMQVSVNEFYQRLGLPSVGSGKYYFWNADRCRHIDIRTEPGLNDMERAYTAIYFGNTPDDCRYRW